MGEATVRTFAIIFNFLIDPVAVILISAYWLGRFFASCLDLLTYLDLVEGERTN